VASPLRTWVIAQRTASVGKTPPLMIPFKTIGQVNSWFCDIALD
jgi:hypothetical protein